MTIIHSSVRTIEVLADEYAVSRKDRTKPISMAAAIRAVRIIQPASSLSESEIAEIIAAKMVEHGHSIEFDAT